MTSADDVLFEGRADTSWEMDVDVDHVRAEAVTGTMRDDANFVCLMRTDGFVSNSSRTGSCSVSAQ